MGSAMLTLALGALVLLVVYALKTYTYWKRRGVPTPPGCVPFVGHFWPIYSMKTNLSDYLTEMSKACKSSVFGIYNMFTPVLVITDTQLIKNVLQTNFSSFSSNVWTLSEDLDPLLADNPFFHSDEKWVKGRKRLTAGFSSMRLKMLSQAMTGVCNKLEDFLERRMKETDNYETELKNFFGRFTAETVAHAGLGIEGHSFSDKVELNSFYEVGTRLFNGNRITGFLLNVSQFKPHIAKFFRLSFFPKHIDEFFRRVVSANLEIRLSSDVKRCDFFQLMLEIEKAESNGEKVNEQMIAAQVASLFVDGFETSRATLSYVGYQLAMHQDVQDKVREEIFKVLEKTNGEATYDAFKEMTYMEQVISESQRMHAAVAYLHKKCTQPFDLESSDGIRLRVEPGTPVVIPIHAVHRNPKYWPDPDKFDPERFNEQNKHKIEKMSFLAFGEGPRICVGLRMAHLVMKSCLTAILRNYKLEISPKMKVPLRYMPAHLIAEPEGGIWVKISKL